MHEKDLLLTTIEIKEAIVGIRQDGIVHVYYKPGITLDVPLQKKMLQIFLDLTKGEKKPFIWEAGTNVRLTREARLNARAIEKTTPVKASVVVAKNWYQSAIAQFYYKINRPGMIYMVTRNFSHGIKWLHKVHTNLVTG